MFRVVQFQLATALIAGVTAWAIGGGHAALSALLGALAIALPNGMFAAHLALAARKRSAISATSAGTPATSSGAAAVALVLLFGEFLKVALTAALLALIILGYRGLVWSALLASVGVVLVVQPLAQIRRRQ